VADTPVDPDELQRLGLYDPDDEHAAERLELIDYLLGLGATLEDLVKEHDELPALASLVGLRPGREQLTLSEAAQRAGAPLDLAQRVWRTSGLPEPGPGDRVCTEADVEVFRTFLAGTELLGEAVVLQLGRVVGSTMARVAEAARSAFLVHVGAPRLLEDPTGLALARANAEAVTMIPGLSRALDVVLRHHFELARRPIDVAAGTRGGYDSQHVTVGFVDLVESTAWGQDLSIGELGVALGEFEAMAADTVAERGGRLVKLIGDEAMFVAADGDAACDVALEIVGGVEAHAVLPPARGGLAVGDVLTREGDYYGPVVNLAARAVEVATRGAVFASEDVGREARAHRFTPVGAQRLKGFDEPVELFRLERAS
jgi:class 3 adenylate cyclase